MKRTFSVRSLGRLLPILAAVGLGLPLQAWKTTLAGSNSVHGRISNGALDVIRTSVNRGNEFKNAEWDRFGVTLHDACGWLNNDSNAHGNLIWNEDRRDPDGNPLEPSLGEKFWDPLNFNGGPFYRWWFRALQAEALCSAVAVRRPGPSTRFQEWSRTRAVDGSSPVDASRIYQYLGLMAHLIQDNSAPAHMANIRHGWWEGVEWWHDAGGTLLGGRGRDMPLDPGRLPSIPLDSATGPNWSEISSVIASSFFNNNKIIGDYDPSKRGRQADPLPYRKFTGLLRQIVKKNVAHLMPGIAVPPPYFDARAGNQSRALTHAEKEALKVWEQGPGTTADEIKFNRGLGQHPIYGNDASGRPLKAAQVQFNGGQLFVQGQWFQDGSHALSDVWHSLNDRRTLWIPNGDYSGEAFDTNFGSYGGHWGFPNRDFPFSAQDDIGLDIRSGNTKGRVFPGDLYVVHPDQNYNPGHDASLDYRDERSFEKVGLNPIIQNSSLADIGGQLVDRAAMWSAVLYETVSKFLPPMMTSFHFRPRGTDGRNDYSKQPLPWFSADLGATISLGFDTNRYEDCVVEFYALPLDQFRQLENWKRTMSLGNPPSSVLFEADLSVFDQFPTETGTSSPPPGTPMPGPDPRHGIRPPYDYCYQQIVGYPVKVVWGERSLEDWNFLSTTSPEDPSPSHLLTVPASQFGSTSGSEGVPITARLPYKFQKTFTWNGEVGDPSVLFPDQFEAGGPSPSNYQALNRDGKKALPSGQYLMMAIVYKQGNRIAFSSNQYKLQNSSKIALEFNDWVNQSWTDAFLQESVRNLTSGASPPGFTLPDELFPIRVDNTSPRVRVE